MWTVVIIGVLVIAGVVFFKLLSGEKERVKTLFRIYKAGRTKFPDITERELLEIVVGELILPGRATQLRNLGITGKQYLDGVFEDKQIDIDELIYHIVCLEFPKKYKIQINLEKMERLARTEELSENDKLKEEIKQQHQKFVSK